MRILLRQCYLNYNRWISRERPEIGMVSPEYTPKRSLLRVEDKKMLFCEFYYQHFASQNRCNK